MKKQDVLDLNIELQDFLDLEVRGAGSIISAVFGQGDFANIPKKVLENAGDRGRAVHEAIEHFILTGEMKINFEYEIYTMAFMEWYNKYNPIFLSTEMRLFSYELGYKGVIDALCIIDGQLVMVDWKTSSNLNVFKSGLQLSLYAKLINHLRKKFKELDDILKGYDISKLLVVSITKTGYKEIEVPYKIKTANALLHLYNEQLKY